MGCESMLCKGQLSVNMQVDHDTSMNWRGPFTEGSPQDDVVVQSKLCLDQIGPLSRGHSASCSPTLGA